LVISNRAPGAGAGYSIFRYLIITESGCIYINIKMTVFAIWQCINQYKTVLCKEKIWKKRDMAVFEQRSPLPGYMTLRTTFPQKIKKNYSKSTLISPTPFLSSPYPSNSSLFTVRLKLFSLHHTPHKSPQTLLSSHIFLLSFSFIFSFFSRHFCLTSSLVSGLSTRYISLHLSEALFASLFCWCFLIS